MKKKATQKNATTENIVIVLMMMMTVWRRREEDIDDDDAMNLGDNLEVAGAENGQMPELQIPNGEDASNLTVQNPSLFVPTESEIILTIPKLVFNDDWFEFNNH
jgi:hypothetical protein